MATLRRRKPRNPAGGTHLRSSIANAAMAVEDRVVLGASDAFHAVGGAVRSSYQRSSSVLHDRVVVPIRDETDGWSNPVRAAALAAVVLLAAAAVTGGVLLSGGSSDGNSPAATRVAISPPVDSPATANAPHAAVKPSEPTGPILHGAQPEFSQESGGGVPQSARSEAAAKAKAVEGAAVSPQSATAATGSSATAGPQAIEVARQFAGAFVLYETGRTDAQVKKVFAQTTAPDLEQALLKRPPRLPANVKVPQAKVLNIVSGPKQGDTYNLSISLLRVGVTSELKVEMQRLKGRWLLTDVQG